MNLFTSWQGFNRIEKSPGRLGLESPQDGRGSIEWNTHLADLDWNLHKLAGVQYNWLVNCPIWKTNLIVFLCSLKNQDFKIYTVFCENLRFTIQILNITFFGSRGVLRFRFFNYAFTTVWYKFSLFWQNGIFFANDPKNWRLKFERKKEISNSFFVYPPYFPLWKNWPATCEELS